MRELSTFIRSIASAPFAIQDAHAFSSGGRFRDRHRGVNKAPTLRSRRGLNTGFHRKRPEARNLAPRALIRPAYAGHLLPAGERGFLLRRAFSPIARRERAFFRKLRGERGPSLLPLGEGVAEGDG
jgi:hypothetical protein